MGEDREILARALAIWQEREMTFPAFVRRMHPDDMDYATGTWARVVEQAKAENDSNGGLPGAQHRNGRLLL